MYRAAKLLDTKEVWAEYTQKARAVKRLVAREKRNAFRTFSDELENTQLSQSQEIIKRIVGGKQKYVIHHQPQGNAQNLREYPLSLNEGSRAPRSIPWSPGTFVSAVNLQDQIEKAIMSMPSKKAAGPDLVLAEAMKTAPKRQAEFLANLRRAVGRAGLLPTQWTKCTIVPLYKKGDATKPNNHHPIALLLHPSKVIENVLDNQICSEYELHPAQL